MARQKSFLKFTGRIGDVSFYRSPDGYMAREKGGVDGDRIATDPVFQRTRENGAEFGTAGKGAKLIRTSMSNLVRSAADRLATGRFTKQMVKVVKADGTSARGSRNVLDGNLLLVEGFDFNIDAPLKSVFLAPYETDVDRVTGKVDISIAPFVPTHAVIAPYGTTHFKIVSASSEIDFVMVVWLQAGRILRCCHWKKHLQLLSPYRMH